METPKQPTLIYFLQTNDQHGYVTHNSAGLSPTALSCLCVPGSLSHRGSMVNEAPDPADYGPRLDESG